MVTAAAVVIGFIFVYVCLLTVAHEVSKMRQLIAELDKRVLSLLNRR